MDNISLQEVVAASSSVLEGLVSNTNQQEVVVEVVLPVLEGVVRINSLRAESVAAAVLPPVPDFLERARTNMHGLLTVVGSSALALFESMVAMKNVSRAEASPQVLHMQNVYLAISFVLIALCWLSFCALLLIYQRNTAHHPCSFLYVRLLKMIFLLAAFSSPFLLLAGFFVPLRLFLAPLIFIISISGCALLASVFCGIPTVPDNPVDTPAPANNP